MSSRRALGIVAIVEATSFLALLVSTYVKHQDGGELGVQILGPIHGLLFLGYVALVLVVRPQARWNVATTVVVLVSAVVPFGGYGLELWLRRTEPAQA
jgi:integral membrane protein